MRYENVYYKVNNKIYVGNMIFVDKEIVFETDKQSINEEYCKIEISIYDIDKNKLKNSIDGETNFQVVIIETKNNKYEFQFNFCDEYERFIEMINKEIL